jgi:hypothetical protein
MMKDSEKSPPPETMERLAEMGLIRKVGVVNGEDVGQVNVDEFGNSYTYKLTKKGDALVYWAVNQVPKLVRPAFDELDLALTRIASECFALYRVLRGVLEGWNRPATGPVVAGMDSHERELHLWGYSAGYAAKCASLLVDHSLLAASDDSIYIKGKQYVPCRPGEDDDVWIHGVPYRGTGRSR